MSREEAQTISRRPYTDEDRELIWKTAQEYKAKGLSLRQCFHDLIQDPRFEDRGPGAISQQYYDMRKERETDGEESAAQAEPIEEPKTEFPSPIMQFLTELPTHLRKIEERLSQMEASQKPYTPGFLAKSLAEMAIQAEKSQKLTQTREAIEAEFSQELEELRRENQRLSQAYQRSEAALAELRQYHQEAEELFQTFINWSSVSQMMGLGQLKQDLRYTLDRFGRVLSVWYEKKAE